MVQNPWNTMPSTPSAHADKLIQEAYTTFAHNNRNTGFTDTADIVQRFWTNLLAAQGKNMLTTLDTTRPAGIVLGDIASRWMSVESLRVDPQGIDNKLQQISNTIPLSQRYVQAFDTVVIDFLTNNQQLWATLLTDYQNNISADIQSNTIQNIVQLMNARELFLTNHPTLSEQDITQLDAVVVQNDALVDTLLAQNDITQAQADIIQTDRLANRDPAHKGIFSQLVTFQKYNEFTEKNDHIRTWIETMARYFCSDSSDSFPPFGNILLQSFPYDHQTLAQADPAYTTNIQSMRDQITIKEQELSAESDTTKHKPIQDDIKDLQKQIITYQRNTYITTIQSQDPELGRIVAKLVDNDFAFDKLDQIEQQYILSKLVSLWSSQQVHNNIPHYFGIDANDYQAFIQNFFDLSQDNIVVPTLHGDINIDFSDKKIAWGPLRDIKSPADLAQMKSFPLHFTINVTDQNEEFLQKSWASRLFQDFTDKTWDTTKLHEWYKVSLTDKEWVTHTWYLSQKSPFKEKTWPNNQDPETWYLYSTPVNVHESPTQRSLPLLAIEPNETQDYALSVLEKKLHLNGDAIGAFLFWYSLEQTRISHPQIDNNKLEQLHQEQTKDVQNYTQTGNEIEDTGMQETPEEENQQNIDDMWQSLFNAKNIKLQEWTRLFFQLWTSPLPPENSDPLRIQAEITKAQPWWNIELDLSWTELWLWDMEGYIRKFPYTVQWLQDLKEKTGNVHALPPNTANFDLERSMIKDSATTLWIEENRSILQGEPKRDGWQFKTADGKSIYHFGMVPDGETQPIIYKVTKDGDGFKVTTDYTQMGEQYDEKWNKLNPKRIKYTRKMDYTSFIVFAATKKLWPLTSQEAKDQKDAYEKEQKPVWQWWFKVNRFSPLEMRMALKWVKDKFMDKWNSYTKDQADLFEDMLVTDFGLYKALWKVLPFRIWQAFWDMHDEHILKRDSVILQKIQDIKKAIEGNPDKSAVVAQVIKPMIAKNQQHKNPLEAAAMLLYMVEKAWYGMYSRWLHEYAGQWRWVLALLGKNHQENYLREKEQLLMSMKWKWDRLDNAMRDQLMQLEMRYIVGAIRWDTNQPDKLALQKIFWISFASEIEGKFNESISSSKIDETYKNYMTKASFSQAFEDLKWQVAQGRTNDVIWQFKAMANLYQNQKQYEDLYMAFILLLTSGVMQHESKEEHRLALRWIANTLGIKIWVRVDDNDMMHKTQHLLDFISQGDFSRSTSYSPIPHGDRTKIKPYVTNMQQRWRTGSNAQKVVNFLSNKEFPGSQKELTLNQLVSAGDAPIQFQGSLVSDYEKSLLRELTTAHNDTTVDTWDKDIANGHIYEQDLPAWFVQRSLMNFRNNDYTWDSKDIRRMKKYWKESLNRQPKDPYFDTNFFFNIFSNAYGNTEYTIKVLAQAAKQKALWNTHQSKALLHYLLIWEISMQYSGLPPEVKKKVKQYETFFYNNIEEIIKPSNLTQISALWWSDEILNHLENAKNDKFMPVDQYENTMRKRQSPEKVRIQNQKKYYTINQTLQQSMNPYRAKNMQQYLESAYTYQNDTSWGVRWNTKAQLNEALDPHGVSVDTSNSDDPRVKKVLEKKDWVELDDMEDDWYWYGWWYSPFGF